MKKFRTRRPIAWDLLENRLVMSAGATAAGAIQPAALAILGTSEATTPTERTDPEAVQAYTAALALAQSGGASNVVFFGDSITARWDEAGYPGISVWNSQIAPLGAVDFGVDGDRTQNLIWRLANGELDGAPKVAVVEIGTNNLVYSGDNESPQETAAGITAVVDTIQAVSPSTKIFVLLGILPRSEDPGDPARAEIQQVNSMIAGLANGPNILYLNLSSLFLAPDGTIPADLMLAPDYLHPNTDGYQLMADAVLTPIDELLGRPAPDLTTYGGPVLVDMPADQTAEESGPSGALLSFPLPLAFDALDPDPVVTSEPARGTILPLGNTVVTCTATDRYGHTASASFTVTVTPEVPPVLQNVPSNQVVAATGPLGAVVNFALPSAIDPSDPDPEILCVPPSGSTFPIGVTTVTCTATDQVGNVATARFTINVTDTTPPAIVAPNLVVQATGPSGAVVNFTALHVSDLVDPNPVFTLSEPSGSTFPIGVTTVTCSAMDKVGNASSTTFLVIVEDTPVLLNPPASMVVVATGPLGAVVRYTAPTAADVADPTIGVVDSPPSGSIFPIGVTTVTCTAKGLSSVSATHTFTVTVVPQQIVTSVSKLAQAVLMRAAAALGNPPATHTRSPRKLTAVNFSQVFPNATTATPAWLAFLSRVNLGSGSVVTLRQMQVFIAVNVDLNHDGRISMYEQALFQLRDPLDSAFLFPGT